MTTITADAEYWRELATKMRRVLVQSREALILSGYVPAGEHGSGDPEINRIDDVIGFDDTRSVPQR